MFIWRKKFNKLDRYAWIPFQAGYERTSAGLLIESTLCHLEKNRSVLMMRQNDKESCQTVLLGHTDKQLLIDLPPEWKIKSLSPRIIFRDHQDLGCHFDTEILFVRSEIIHARVPECIFRLQRRMHPRMEVPAGSMAAAAVDDGDREPLTILNISAGGMLCCAGNKKLREGSALRDLELVMAPTTSACMEMRRFRVPGGRIVRKHARGGGDLCYGIAFIDRESSGLDDYLRGLEIELVGDAAGQSPELDRRHAILEIL